MTGNPEGTLPKSALTGASPGHSTRVKVHTVQLTPLDAPATPTRAPVPAHRKSAAGRRTPSTPPQTIVRQLILRQRIVPRRAPEDSGSSPPKPVADSVR